MGGSPPFHQHADTTKDDGELFAVANRSKRSRGKPLGDSRTLRTLGKPEDASAEASVPR
jgi:hypothetical protein